MVTARGGRKGGGGGGVKWCWKQAKTNATATAHGPPPVVPPPNLLISFPRPNSASRRSKNCFTLGFGTVTGGELEEGGVGTQRIREGVSESRPKPHLISSNRILTEKPVAPFRIHPSGQPSAATQTIMRQDIPLSSCPPQLPTITPQPPSKSARLPSTHAGTASL